MTQHHDASLFLPGIAYDDAGTAHEAWSPETAPVRSGLNVQAVRAPEGLTFGAVSIEAWTRAGYTTVRFTPAQARQIAVALIEAASTIDLSNAWDDRSRHDLVTKPAPISFTRTK